MNLYAESSAILAWLLGERSGVEVRKSLASAEIVVASDLALVECDRVLIRATVLRQISEADADKRRAILNRAATRWIRLRLDAEILERGRRPFPNEPIRTLDALHLSSALVARQAVPDITFLTLDARIRASAEILGFPLLPRHL